jgi:hypothetical protein
MHIFIGFFHESKEISEIMCVMKSRGDQKCVYKEQMNCKSER